MRQLVKLPDVLLTDDEDAAYLSEGDALRVVLHGTAPALQELRSAPLALLPLASSGACETGAAPAAAASLAVLRLPGPHGSGWGAAAQEAWLDALLSWGWGCWDQLGHQLQVRVRVRVS